MLYAHDTNGARFTPSPGLRADCPSCGAEVIAKCGQINRWHWSHYARPDCDSWWEPETLWHLGWKQQFAAHQVEVVIGGHRADAVAADGRVIEFQHSPISPAEIKERERFYQRMVWLFDAADFEERLEFRDDFRPAVWGGFGRSSCVLCHKPLGGSPAAGSGWTRAGDGGFCRVHYRAHFDCVQGLRWFRWKHPRKSLARCSKPTFWDFGASDLLWVKQLSGDGRFGWAKSVPRTEFLEWLLADRGAA